MKLRDTLPAFEDHEKKPRDASGAAPASSIFENTLVGAAKLPVKTFQLWFWFQNPSETPLMLRTDFAPFIPLAIDSAPFTVTVSKPVVSFVKSQEKVELLPRVNPLLKARLPTFPTPGLNVAPFSTVTAFPNEPRPERVDPVPDTVASPLTVTPEATSTRPPPENATEVADTLPVRRTTPVEFEFVTWKLPPPVIPPTFTAAVPVLETDTFPLEFDMLPIVVVPDPLFEIATPAALDTKLVVSVPESDFVIDNEPDVLSNVPVKAVLPPPLIRIGEPATLADPKLTKPVEFVLLIVRPALLVTDPLKLIPPVPVPEFVIVNSAGLVVLLVTERLKAIDPVPEFVIVRPLVPAKIILTSIV